MGRTMKSMRITVAILCLCFVATADEPKVDVKQQTITKALETFTGHWEIVSTSPERATKDARQLVFNKDGTYSAVDKNGKELWAGTFEIDPTVTPKVWDHRSHDAQKDGKDVLGIYELNGNTLKVACVIGQWKGKEWIGKARPKGFDPKTVDVVIELKRAKSDK